MTDKFFKIIFACLLISIWSFCVYANDLSGTYIAKEGQLLVTKIHIDPKIVDKLGSNKNNIKAFYMLNYKLKGQYAKCSIKYAAYESIYKNYRSLFPIDELNKHITGDRTWFIFNLNVNKDKLVIVMPNAVLHSPAGMYDGLIFKKK